MLSFKELIAKITGPFSRYWNGIDNKKRITVVSVFCVLLAAAAIAVSLASRTEYAAIYRDISTKEAGEIVSKLQSMNIDVKTEGEGTILIPKSQVSTTKMLLAAEGYPKTGMTVEDYNSYASGLSTTEGDKKRYWNIILQEQIKQSILKLDPVENATVTLSIPDNSSYALIENKREPSANVVIQLKHGSELTASQIQAVESLVTTSVNGLKEENVSIVDTSMKKLNRGSDEGDESPAGGNFELEQKAQNAVKNELLNVLEPLFGHGGVTAAVALKLNFDSKTSESETYTPVVGESGITISSQETIEKNQGETISGNVGQDPNGDLPEYTGQNENNTSSTKVDTVKNYEVNKLIERVVKSNATVDNMTVSVVIDENLNPDVDIAKVTAIVSKAVGLDEQNITVTSLPFNGSKIASTILGNNSQSSAAQQLPPARQAIVYSSLAVLLILLLIIIYRIIKDKQYEREIDTLEMNAVYRASDGSAAGLAADSSAEENIEPDTPEFYYAEIKKQVRDNPENVVQILRTWLNER